MPMIESKHMSYQEALPLTIPREREIVVSSNSRVVDEVIEERETQGLRVDLLASAGVIAGLGLLLITQEITINDVKLHRELAMASGAMYVAAAAIWASEAVDGIRNRLDIKRFKSKPSNVEEVVEQIRTPDLPVQLELTEATIFPQEQEVQMPIITTQSKKEVEKAPKKRVTRKPSSTAKPRAKTTTPRRTTARKVAVKKVDEIEKEVTKQTPEYIDGEIKRMLKMCEDRDRNRRDLKEMGVIGPHYCTGEKCIECSRFDNLFA